MTPTQSILRAATREKDGPLNVLTYSTHERVQSMMSGVNAVFYLWQGQDIKPWKTEYAPLPPNHILLNKSRGRSQIPPEVDIDVVLSQNKFAHYQVSRSLAQHLHVPLICLEHCLPPPNWPKAQIQELKTWRGDINLFISAYSRKVWGWDENEAEVIHHGLDTEMFKPDESVPKSKHCLYVVNDLKNRDWCCGYKEWEEATQGLPRLLVGDNPGLSKAAANVDELVKEYQRATVFSCTATVSPIPTVVLESMACGTPVVALNNCMLPEVIEHGVNGFLVKSPQEMRQHLIMLLNDTALAAKMGVAARETIVKLFNVNLFVQNWNTILRRAAEMPYGVPR